MDVILGLVRHLLGAGGAALATNGWIDAAQSEQLVGALLAIGAIAWSAWDKKSKKKKK